MPPRVSVFHNSGAGAFDLPQLEAMAARAVPRCLESALQGAALTSLANVEVALVSDEAIARVHAEFLDDPTPTDVITFDYGEILISTESAARQGAEHETDAEREVGLYIVHGLLHLAGHDDHAPKDFERMKQLQEEILAAVW